MAEISDTPNGLMKLSQAAEYLGIPKERLRIMVRGNKIPYYRFGPRDTRFDKKDLDAWLASCRQG